MYIYSDVTIYDGSDADNPEQEVFSDENWYHPSQKSCDSDPSSQSQTSQSHVSKLQMISIFHLTLWRIPLALPKW